jgi:small-conductance mechanosensitive channel
MLSPRHAQQKAERLMDNIVGIVVIVLIVLFVLGYFGRGRFRA